MKACLLFLAILLVSIIAAVAADAGPEPAPWWMRVEETQNLALRWITAISIVVGAIMAAGIGILAKLKELKERQNRASQEKIAMQAQITDLAKQIPPNGTPDSERK